MAIAFAVPDQTFVLRRVFKHKIELAINNLIVTIRMQRKINTNITAKLDRSVKMRSMQDNELSNGQVGSDICCCCPCTVVNESMSIH